MSESREIAAADSLFSELKDHPWLITIGRADGCLIVYVTSLGAARRKVPRTYEGLPVRTQAMTKARPA